MEIYVVQVLELLLAARRNLAKGGSVPGVQNPIIRNLDFLTVNREDFASVEVLQHLLPALQWEGVPSQKIGLRPA